MDLHMFDTHSMVKTLMKAGFDEKQAEAQVEIVIACTDANFATKRNLLDVQVALSHEIEAARTEQKHSMTMIKWGVGIVIAAVVPLAMKSFLL